MTQGRNRERQIPTLDATPHAALLDDAAVRRMLERDGLPSFLAGQRWFAGKARRIDRVRIADWGVVPDVTPPLLLTIVAVTDDQATAEYFVPMVLASTRPPVADPDLAIVAHVGDTGIALLDAVVDDDVCVALAHVLSSRDDLALAHGRVTPRFPGGEPPADGPLRPVVRGKAEQSNTTVFLARRLALKLIRKLDNGPNPDVEIGLVLAEVGFTHAPRLAAALVYHPHHGPATTLAMLQQFVANEGNGWEQAQQEVRRYLEVVDRLRKKGVSPPAAARDPLGRGDLPGDVRDAIPYLKDAETLGRRTAELHLALARGTDDAFVPEPATTADIVELARGMREHGHAALTLLAEHQDRIPPQARDLAAYVLAHRDALYDQFDRLASAPIHASHIRVHGDYHLGQVLRTGADFVIVDFEGEPMRSLDERRRKHFALKDVAGLLRSFDYAIFDGLQGGDEAAGRDAAAIDPWVRVWQTWTSSRFVRAYRDTVGAAEFVPSSDEGFTLALNAFLLDRALYELVYELNNRPTWVTVPLYGLQRFTVSARDGSP